MIYLAADWLLVGMVPRLHYTVHCKNAPQTLSSPLTSIHHRYNVVLERVVGLFTDVVLTQAVLHRQVKSIIGAYFVLPAFFLQWSCWSTHFCTTSTISPGTTFRTFSLLTLSYIMFPQFIITLYFHSVKNFMANCVCVRLVLVFPIHIIDID